jgi:4-hydroxyphenylpyruvate dioxygenase-like putative hemolysin
MIFHEKPTGGQNRFGFNRVDHVTSNFRTLMPAILWMEHVLGLEPFWKIEFHTDDAADKLEKGSGLRSTVMWDPESGVKFANNEPADRTSRPRRSTSSSRTSTARASSTWRSGGEHHPGGRGEC